MKKNPLKFYIPLLLTIFCALSLGALLGLGLAETVNTINIENFTEFNTSLPTRLLDINGEVITEFASDEKRELISIDELPEHMINALLTREDRNFYKHDGFSLMALMRAVLGQITGRDAGGGSTLTQQIAGTLYCDRAEKSISRKLKELWWSIQMERRYSKNDILELYLNKIYLGGGTYGVNAASKYYFGHGASEITPAEAAILVIQLSNPAHYNPFEHPSRAQERQRDVLNNMVSFGYLTKDQAESSFEEYWGNFDYTRTNTSAYYMREDKAPWFSQYVLSELNSLIFGKVDIYTGGFTVNTTMNLKNQTAAQSIMEQKIQWANNKYKASSGARKNDSIQTYIPIVELLALAFDLPKLKVTEERKELQATNTFEKEINPILDALSLVCGIDNLKTDVVNRTNAKMRKDAGKVTIEGALISIENDTGYITALVGGSKFDADNQFIRATQAKIQPGSTFKPLYYSAAIESKQFTAATMINDAPVIFYNEAGTPYLPENFKGEWVGPVQLWYALAKSMNVPSLKVLDGIGFDLAINHTAKLLGIPDNEIKERGFERVYPLGLGVISVRPIEMAKAFAVFANQGKEVTPLAIRSVEDKNGNIYLDPERELRIQQRSKGKNAQLLSPQSAFIMTDILKNSVSIGTLASASEWGAKFRYRDANGKQYQMPAAGKTGTTQNWTNAWAVGFTPYYTTAVWFGFDQLGQSLGLDLTGATLAGPAWADYMRIANEDKPYKEFAMPQTGLVKATVCSKSGKVLTSACGDNTTTQYFLEGTEPTEACDYHTNRVTAETIAVTRIENEFYASGVDKPVIQSDTSPIVLDLSFLDAENLPEGYEQQSAQNNAFDGLFNNNAQIDENGQTDNNKRFNFWDLFSSENSTGNKQNTKQNSTGNKNALLDDDASTSDGVNGTDSTATSDGTEASDADSANGLDGVEQTSAPTNFLFD